MTRLGMTAKCGENERKEKQMRTCNCALPSIYGSKVCEDCGYVSTKPLSEFKVVQNTCENASEITRKTNASDDLISRADSIAKIESEWRKWGEEYEVTDILCDLSDMPTASQWIPCSERLPSEDEVVLVCLRNKGIEIDRVIDGEWLINEDEVIAWMELPKPFKGDELWMY